MNSLISVIVPVYKVEDYLQKCVESIDKQTYKNIEIILVDDGSPDHCPEICDKLAKQNQKIRVLHKQNGGLSDARNAGMKIAKGEYYCFVDSDDCIRPTMLERLAKAIETYNVKLALCGLKTVDEEGNRVFAAEENPIVSGVYKSHELLPKLYQSSGWYYIVAWNKLYHRELFSQIEFPKGKVHEDEFVIAELMCKAGEIACISSEEYLYTYRRMGSIMSMREVQSQCDWLEALYLRFQFVKNKMELSDFTKETRAVYFRELNNLFLKKELSKNSTMKQKRIAKKQYAVMDGKTNSEKVNWLLFRISPRLEQHIVTFIRKLKG